MLEHSEKPLQILSEIYRLLKPEGLLVVTLPNYKGLIPRLRPISWQGWVPQEHVWHFSPQTLSDLLERMGFKVIELKLTAMCTPIINNRVKRIVYHILNWLGEKCGMGDNVWVTAKKQ